MSEPIISVSGVRGIIGDSLTPTVVCQLVQSFAALLSENKTAARMRPIAVGRDSRPSGVMVEQAATAALLACGLAVRPLGIVATPTAALAVRDLRCAGGVMITASHNPGEYNGLKFMASTGQCLSAESMARLVAIRAAGRFPLADHKANFAVDPDTEATARHVERVLACVDVERIRKHKLAVLLDSVNGAGGIGGAMLLERLGCRALLDNTEPTGRFPRPPEPAAENLAEVCRRVAETSVVVGLVQDPDADRLALIDETGRYIGEEFTLVLAAMSVLTDRIGRGAKPGLLAANLSTSRMIDDLAARFGARVFRSAVGEANVVATMTAHRCVLGGEGNGGVIDPRVVPVRDSLTGMALVLDLLARSGKSLGGIVADLPRYHMEKHKFPLPAGGVDGLLTKAAAAGAGGLINDADGVRIDWPDGWVHIRASNTEPAYRIIAEGRDEQAVARILGHIRSAVG